MRLFSKRSIAQRSRLTLSSSSSQTGSIGRSASALRPFARSFSRRRRKDVIAAYLFLAPGFALFALVILYPIARAFQISLYEWSIVPGATSIGDSQFPEVSRGAEDAKAVCRSCDGRTDG